MSHLRFVVIATVTVLTVSGCARFNIGNGSTEYKTTKILEPLNVPSNLMMRPQKPLYPAPLVEERALANAPQFTNAKGNRYELPRAKSVTSVAPPVTQFAVSKPVMVKDGNQNPLLKIDGSSIEVWKIVQTAASVANLKATPNAKAPYQLDLSDSTVGTLKDDANPHYSIRLTPTGSSNTVGVYDSNNRYAAPEIAEAILASLVQNWVN